MKKYLFMLLAMVTVAFGFTSCGSDDDDYVYSGTSTFTIYDPANELTKEQTADLQALLNTDGTFKITDAASESEFQKKLLEWMGSFNNKLASFLVKYPEVYDTKQAGLKLVSTGLGQTKTEIHAFCELKEGK